MQRQKGQGTGLVYLEAEAHYLCTNMDHNTLLSGFRPAFHQTPTYIPFPDIFHQIQDNVHAYCFLHVEAQSDIPLLCVCEYPNPIRHPLFLHALTVRSAMQHFQ